MCGDYKVIYDSRNENLDELLEYSNLKANIGVCKQCLMKLCKMLAAPSDFIDTYDWDVQFSAAFEELQAYRDIGTVEEFKKLKQAENDH